jgi:hypothetical protein
METIRAPSARIFLQEINILHHRYSNSDEEFIFRGHGEAGWPLLPQAFRKNVRIPGASKTTRKTNREQIYQEFDMLHEFILRANEVEQLPGDFLLQHIGYPPAINDLRNKLGRSELVWPPPEAHTLLAMAQHHGLPTRLMDWTYRPYTAAYFAARESTRLSSQKDLCVYALNTESGHFKKYGFTGDIFTQLGAKQDLRFYQFIKTRSSFSSNMRAQVGVFLAYVDTNFHPNGPFNPPSVEDYVKSINAPQEVLFQISLAAKHAKELLYLLSREGYTAMTAFPNLTGCSESIKEQDIWIDEGIGL